MESVATLFEGNFLAEAGSDLKDEVEAERVLHDHESGHGFHWVLDPAREVANQHSHQNDEKFSR